MVKCPKCGKEIEYLKHWQKCWVSYTFNLFDGSPCYELADDINPTDDNAMEYICPQCSELVTRDEKEAIKILKGG